MKIIYYWIPVGQKNYEESHLPCCPCCGFNNETFDHLYQCPDKRRVQSRNDSFQTMEKYLQTKKVPIHLRNLVIKMAKAFCAESDLVIHNAAPETNAVIASQTNFELSFFMRGFLTDAWQMSAESSTTEDVSEQMATSLLTNMGNSQCNSAQIRQSRHDTTT